jgi:hypothetical protein
MAGVRKKPIRGGKYQGWFINGFGKRQFFTGTRNKAETLRIAHLLAPVRKQAKITGFKFCQVVLRAQWCIDALSLQKGARQL